MGETHLRRVCDKWNMLKFLRIFGYFAVGNLLCILVIVCVCVCARVCVHDENISAPISEEEIVTAISGFRSGKAPPQIYSIGSP